MFFITVQQGGPWALKGPRVGVGRPNSPPAGREIQEISGIFSRSNINLYEVSHSKKKVKRRAMSIRYRTDRIHKST